MASEQLVEHRAKSIDIRRLVKFCSFTGSLFRRHVARCAHHFQRARDRAFCFQQSGQSEICEMGFAVLIEQDVPWFDVTMKNAVFMRVMHSAREFGDQFHRAPDRHRLTPDHFIKLTAFDELHAEVA